MNFLEMTSELTGVLPGLSPFLAKSYLNRAWVDICNRRQWSWLKADGSVICPTQITAGLVSFVRGGLTVTADATASAVLATQQATALPTLTNMQIRFGASTPAVGQIYNIVAYDATNPAAVVLTVDRPIVEATNATSGYQCYRCYIVAPSPGGGRAFLGWESLTDMVNGWTLGRNYTSGYLDVRDPQRQAQGMSYYLADYENTRTTSAITGATAPNPNQSAGVPNYELWPHPTAGQTFYARMQLKGQAFVQPTEEIPTNIIDPQMVISRTLFRYAYPWALANQAHFPTLKISASAYQLLITMTQQTYNELMLVAINQDETQGLQNVWNRGHGLRGGQLGNFKGLNEFPIDSAFLQSHLVRF